MRCKNEEDYKRTLLFLELEAKMDQENFIEMTKIEPSHLTKGKITAISKLGGQYKRASNALIKKYKETFKQKKEWDRIDYFGKEKTWITDVTCYKKR